MRRKGESVPITFALGLGTFLMLFDVTAVVVAMPGIAKDLGFAVAGSAWVIDAYSLAFTGALLASGALADRFGRRRSMLIRQCRVSRCFDRMWPGDRWPDAAGLAGRAGRRGRLHGHGRNRARRRRISEPWSASTGVRHHRGDFRCRHGLGPDLGRLARLVVRLALDLLRQHPLLPFAGRSQCRDCCRDQ